MKQHGKHSDAHSKSIRYARQRFIRAIILILIFITASLLAGLSYGFQPISEPGDSSSDGGGDGETAYVESVETTGENTVVPEGSDSSVIPNEENPNESSDSGSAESSDEQPNTTEETAPSGGENDGGASVTDTETDGSLVSETDELQNQQDLPVQPFAWSTGSVTIDGITYQHFSDGRAKIVYGSTVKPASQEPEIWLPSEIKSGNETYTVTKIDDNAFDPGLVINKVYVNTKARMSDKIVHVPDTVDYIGFGAFNQRAGKPLKELWYKQVAYVDGDLPDLTAGVPHAVPEEAKTGYESCVDSTQDNTTLHKSAKWTHAQGELLNNAEIRIDYGKHPNHNGKLDFVFVIDHSGSMMETVETQDRLGNSYTLPRNIISNDIVLDASRLLLDDPPPSYDNRVAVVGFGGAHDTTNSTRLLWTIDFTENSGTIQEGLRSHPATNSQFTNYSLGLSEAMRIIDYRPDTSRTPVIVFLGDGISLDYGIWQGETLPLRAEDRDGKSQAEQLRERNVDVYPIGIFLGDDRTQAIENLQAISHDKLFYRDVKDASSFQTILTDVMNTIINQEVPLNVIVTDTIAHPFEPATGTDSDITLSPGGGSAKIKGDQIIWDLTGCDSDLVHNVRIKVKVKEDERTLATGSLPTNSSLKISDGVEASEQPELVRYLVHHAFENASYPGQPLPQAIEDLRPQSKGGYQDGTDVQPTDFTPTEVTDEYGINWTFLGWDNLTGKISGGDYTFKGAWKIVSNDFDFKKVNEDGTGIPGVTFNLYRWDGSSEPVGDDRYVESKTTGPDRWVQVNGPPIISGSGGEVRLTFDEAGRFQLVETATPAGYYLPECQWLFIVGSDNRPASINTVQKADSDAIPVDFDILTGREGDEYRLLNYNQSELAFLKIVSGENKNGEITRETLSGAEFLLYRWVGSGVPSPTELATASNPSKWDPVQIAVSQNDGKVQFRIPTHSSWIYQLEESKAPKNYLRPSGQWRITFASDGKVLTPIQLIPGYDGVSPPALERIADGEFAGELALNNLPVFLLPNTGGHGRLPFLIIGGATLLTGGAALTVSLVKAVKKKKP